MKKPKQKIVQTEDSIEAIKGLGGAVKKTAVQESKNIVYDMWKQMLRPNELPQTKVKEPQKQPQKAGDLKPGEELSLKEEKKLAHIEPGIDYSREIVHSERKIQAQESHENKMRIQEIMLEIKKLTKSSKELEIKFKDVQLETVPQSAGKYHANFVEWVLSMLRSAREKVDTTLSWTTALHSKRKQRTYWSLYKKHGAINFGLSGERVVATQAG